jgi:pantoate--beta-alanine ligase
MLVIKTIEELKDVLFRIRSNGKSVGFVPTMGALHEGHLSLIRKAKAETEVVVCSIFINPVQFNNRSDLINYPRDLASDIVKIENWVDLVFAPSPEEIYPEPPKEHFSFGSLENVMEGASRPGHFNGVAIIVKKFLEWIAPDKAYFGEKDFQQLVIIQKLVKEYNINTQIISCPIVREENGLAMSSRNKRLSEHEFGIAGNINRILQESQKLIHQPVKQIKSFVVSEIGRIPEFKLDYFEIVDDKSLQNAESLDDCEGIVGCIALYLGQVRLIDNVRYK